MRSLPRTRAECAAGPRPCPYLRCRYHLAELAPASSETCALDVAERGDHGVEELARVLRVSVDTLVALETKARGKLGPYAEKWGLTPSPVRPAQERLRETLRRHGPLGRAALAEILGESNDNVTKLLTTLKQGGVVEQPSFNVWQLAGGSR